MAGGSVRRASSGSAVRAEARFEFSSMERRLRSCENRKPNPGRSSRASKPDSLPGFTMKRSCTLLDIVVLAIAATAGIVFLHDSPAFRVAAGPTAQQELPPFDRVTVQGFAELMLVPGS